MEKERYTIELEPLTAVHIGTGNELTMLDYKTCSLNKKKEIYIRYNSDSILQRIATQPEKMKEFEQFTSKNDMKAIKNFFHKEFKLDEDLLYPCDMTKTFLLSYNKNLQKDPYDNAAIVQEIYRPAGKKTPVIPGSSVKGAIRTALLQDFLLDLNKKEYDKLLDEFKKDSRKIAKFENDILKKIFHSTNAKDAKKDPFRALQISDLTFEEEVSQIVGKLITIEKNGIKKKTKIQIQAEAIKGKFMNSHSIANGTIIIDKNLSKATTKEISKEDLVYSCNDFYTNVFAEEYEKFYKNAEDGTDLILNLKKLIEETSKSENQFIIRLGRWSQVESMTFEEPFRKPYNKKGYGKTRTVFDYDGQFLPMGWCLCSIKESQ